MALFTRETFGKVKTVPIAGIHHQYLQNAQDETKDKRQKGALLRRVPRTYYNRRSWVGLSFSKKKKKRRTTGTYLDTVPDSGTRETRWSNNVVAIPVYTGIILGEGLPQDRAAALTSGDV